MRDLKYVDIIIGEISNHLGNLITVSGKDFLKWTSQVRTYRTLIENLVSDSNRKKELLANLSVIIRDLQFHDILEQKIQHIIDINKKIFDLNLAEFKEPFLASILQFQLKLLVNIQNEYEASSRNIRTMLISIWDEEKVENEVDKNIDLIFDGAYLFTRKRLSISMLIENLKLKENTDIDWSDEKYMFEIESIVEIFSMKTERDIFNEVFGLESEEDISEDIDLF